LQNYSLYEQNLNHFLNLLKKERYDKTTKYAIANIDGKEIYITEFLFAKQRGYINELRGHGEIEVGYYRLLPYIFQNIQEIHLDAKNSRLAYIISDNNTRKIYHIVDKDDFLLSIYIVREKEHQRFLKKAKKIIKSNPDGEAPVSPILSPAWAAFWRHLEMIEQLYQIFTSKPIYLFSISSHSHAININSLDITFFKPKIEFFKYDYLIITSKQACEALKQYNKNDYINLPSLCVSTPTAKKYENLGGKILCIGDGYGNTLGDKIKKYPKTAKWLYLRAKTVASDFVCTCQNEGYNIDEAIVYESKCSEDILHAKIKNDAVLIFTSPSSIKCFLKNHTMSPHAKIVVIGETTAKALPDGFKYTLSDKTTIESCIQMAKKLYPNNSIPN